MNTISIFDPEKLLDDVTTEAASRRPPLPGGEEFTGILGTPKFRVVQGKKDPTSTYTFLDIPVRINVRSNPTTSNYPQEEVVLSLQGSVEFKEGSSSLDWSAGKNAYLRRVREATNTNVAGQAFSIRGLEGRQVIVRIKNREYPEGSGELVDDIDSVIKPH